MEADCEYKVLLDDVSVGHMKTNLGGKLSFSADLSRIKLFVWRLKIISDQKPVMKSCRLTGNGRVAAYVVYEGEQE